MDSAQVTQAAAMGLLLALALPHAVSAGLAREPARMEEDISVPQTIGLEPQSIRLASAGYVLDFRYRVVHPERAAGVINKTTQPYLIDEATGFSVRVPAPPKIGPLRHTGNNLAAGRTYFILFANPARKIKSGDRVTVVLGEHRIEHLIVQ